MSIAWTTAWPTEIRVPQDKRALKVTFDDGRIYSIPAELLRVLSPSAEVQGHSPEQRRLQPGKREVRIYGVQHVGSYAVRLEFDDGHDTGIYTWQYLRDLGENVDVRTALYAQELEAAGLSRD